jgi:hypothetical protein
MTYVLFILRKPVSPVVAILITHIAILSSAKAETDES